MHCPYCRNTDTRVLDSRVADDGGSIRRRRTCCERCEQAVHDRRADAADRAQALRRDRAVHPREGRSPASGRPARAARSPRTTWPAWARRSRTRCAARAPPRSRPTRSGWRSSARCARSTRSPTCASPASTAPSSPPTTSRPRSRCCAPSAPRPPRRWPSWPPQPLRADPRPPGVCSGEARAPGAPTVGGPRDHRSPAARATHDQQHDARHRAGPDQEQHSGRTRRIMTETVSGATGSQQRSLPAA